MKRLIVLIITVCTVFSCGEEIRFNSPAIQAKKNGEFWRSVTYAADIDYGGFLIEGSNNFETVQLFTDNDTRGTFQLGGDNSSVAIFKDANGIIYSTANMPDPSLSVYPADGEIIIEDISNDDPKQISGKFWFNAYSSDGLRYVNFSQGVLFDVPNVGGLFIMDNQGSCLQATQQAANAENAFNQTDDTMPDYTDLCNAYKLALEEQLAACGDPNGSIQSIIDSLGDCQ
ncbi:DUF6252 family protein [Hanstruepera flava]|uniref:DUF6252 family protein n=1 Tax=Hanstruepera flava TaxID=2930218 RepID=UPI0020294D66|nr:DUF6252 family protein [Hanstruepera flava]